MCSASYIQGLTVKKGLHSQKKLKSDHVLRAYEKPGGLKPRASLEAPFKETIKTSLCLIWCPGLAFPLDETAENSEFPGTTPNYSQALRELPLHEIRKCFVPTRRDSIWKTRLNF
jgi:hypothetical protein